MWILLLGRKNQHTLKKISRHESCVCISSMVDANTAAVSVGSFSKLAVLISHVWAGLEKAECVYQFSQKETGILLRTEIWSLLRISDYCVGVHICDLSDTGISLHRIHLLLFKEASTGEKAVSLKTGSVTL